LVTWDTRYLRADVMPWPDDWLQGKDIEWKLGMKEFRAVEEVHGRWPPRKWNFQAQVSSHLISSHLISSHLISSHLISSHQEWM